MDMARISPDRPTLPFPASSIYSTYHPASETGNTWYNATSRCYRDMKWAFLDFLLHSYISTVRQNAAVEDFFVPVEAFNLV